MAWTTEKTSRCEATTAVPAEVSTDKHPDKTKDTAVVDKCEIKKQQNEILINLTVVCISFCVHVTAFAGLVNLQSSLNSKRGFGHTLLTIMFLLPIVCNLLVASTIARLVGYKRCMVYGLLVSSAFPVANLYPTIEFLYIGATITGLVSGILWSAHGSYVTALGKRYATLGHRSSEATIARFFGVFFMTHRLAMVFGSLASSAIFQRPKEATHLPPDVVRRICGSAYCYEDLDAHHWTMTANHSYEEQPFVNDTGSANSSLLYRPSSLQLYSLFGFYSVCGFLAPVILAVFLKRPAEPMEDQNIGKVHLFGNIVATLKTMVDFRFLLLVPIMALHGASQAFLLSDYGVGFITCTLGIDSVGYIMATFGLTSALTAFVSGILVKYTGRQAMFFFNAVWTLATLIAMWKWSPNSSHPEVLYAFAAVWGVCTTVWTAQLISYVGFLFRNESPQPAMASYYVILNLSIGCWFLLARNLCLHAQLHLLMLLLAVGMVGYMMVEILVRRGEKEEIEGQMKQTTTSADQVTKI